MALKILFTIIAIGYTVSGVPFASEPSINNDVSSGSEFIKTLNKCALHSDSDEMFNCASERLVRSLNLLSSQPKLEILPGVSLLSDGNIPSFRSGKQLSDEIEKAKSTNGNMWELLTNATARIFSGRTLKIKLPSSEDISRALEEGRKQKGGGGGGGKKYKGHMTGMMGIGALMAGLIPIFLTKVALIATKALIVGKIALALSAFLLIPSLLRGGGGGGGGNSAQTHTAEISWAAPQTAYGPPSNSYGPPSNSYGVPSPQFPYSRSFNDFNEQQNYSQEIAYSEQKN
ncbi:hypothetical protein ABEB36_010204 [Hypothenemus hampei]|uniref:Uncharacterized protein n=1 Tax=Hypothenemus hampei TaxID=57062 RepID=A0ABD1ELT3_HYPHA